MFSVLIFSARYLKRSIFGVQLNTRQTSMGPRNSDVFIALTLLATVLAQSSEVGSPPDYSGTKQREGPECELPRSRGKCTGKYTRFYYDKTSGQCKGFKYSGCGGNLNNFESLSDCNHRCICSRQLAVGTCSQGQPRYFYNKATGLCQVFAYSGCGGNVNNFLMEDHCKSVCIDPEIRRRCLRRPEVGSCTNNMTRFYYDVNCDCCRQFSYSGCDGNRNNFETENSCLQKCHSIEGMRGATTNIIPVPTASVESSTASPTTAAPSKKDAGSNMIIIQTNPGPPPGQRINNIFQQLLNNMMLSG